MEKVIQGILGKLETGDVQAHGNMTVVPLFIAVDGGPKYQSLGKALAQGLLVITEVSEGGMVPELKVINKGDLPVLLLDGEELAEAKQNRMLNTTILLRKNSEMVIPVSCTEHGRWSYVSKTFDESGNVVHRRLRRDHVASVHASLREGRQYRGDQAQAWDGIARIAEEAAAPTATGAMRDVFAARESDLEGYTGAFRCAAGQKGMAVVVNGEVAGVDFLSHGPVFEELFPKLVRSYAMDALLQKGNKGGGDAVSQVKGFLEKAGACEESRYKSAGHGWDHRFEGLTVVGSALVSRAAVIHPALFPKDENGGTQTGRMSSASQRRRFRQ
jgi:hypothetical protein